MSNEEMEIIRLVVEALSAPRDRFRRLESYTIASERLRKLLINMKAPNGGLDTVDQCRMVLQGLIGDDILSLHS